MASAAANMRSLARDLPHDEPAIQAAKRSEFHSLGLVLGYTYAGSPVIQPGHAGPGRAAAGDVSSYTPDAVPGARLPHAWLPDGALAVRPAGRRVHPARAGRAWRPGGAAAGDEARRRDIPMAVVQAPPDYPWGGEFLLVRPDQHIAWRARDAAGIDLDLVTRPRWPGPASTGQRRRCEQHETRCARRGPP